MAITDEQRANFLARVAGGRSVRDVCSNEDMPSRTVIYEELAANKDFADHYARACDMRADEGFDEIFEIADDGRNDWIETREDDARGWRENGESLRRSQIRIDARKWALARMSPRKYGDKLDLNHGGGVTVLLSPDTAKL